MTNAPRIAVAIPTFNREAILIETLEGVFAQDPPADEVLVVDQTESHTPEVQCLLDRWSCESRIRYFRQSPPSLPAARNRALKETGCDILIFIDDDVKLDQGFVEAHRANYVQNCQVKAVAGRVVQEADSNYTKEPKNRPTILDYRFFQRDSTEKVSGVATFIGCNHSVRVDYALELGGYDEIYQGVALREETDMAIRIFINHGLIIFDPAASLFHYAAPSGGCRKKFRLDVSGGVSVLNFAWKFRDELGVHAFHEVWRAIRIAVLSKQLAKRPYLVPIAFWILVFKFLRLSFVRKSQIGRPRAKSIMGLRSVR